VIPAKCVKGSEGETCKKTKSTQDEGGKSMSEESQDTVRVSFLLFSFKLSLGEH
jgi:hypothetical protein